MYRDFSKCPRCGSSMIPSTSYTGSPSQFWVECMKCNTYVNTYIPQEHQEATHQDPHRIVGNFGGYGTGKTTTTREEVYKHIFLTPNANILIGANVVSQYEQTIKRELEADVPAAFVKDYNTQKSYMDFTNGARIMYRPFDDAEKLRSYNLSMFVIIEGSECKPAAYNQLKTRLRNLASTKPFLDKFGKPIYKKTKRGQLIPKIQYDWSKGIVESNPDSGYIRTDILMVSSEIKQFGHTIDHYTVLPEEADKHIASFIASSDVNLFLPPDWMETNTKNKPAWWINKFILGSFNYAQGTVYPSAMEHFVPDFPIQPAWKRICAFDYGLSDDSRYLFGAVDEISGVVYIYKEITANDTNVEVLAKLFHDEAKSIPVGGWICQPLIDPKSAPKRDYFKKSLLDHFLDYGINFKPGQIQLDARIFRLNTYFEQGRLKIFDSCGILKKELREYKFAPRTLDDKVHSDKPVDKNNHSINPLEWIVMELPADPKNLVHGIYDRFGNDITKAAERKKQEEDYRVYALSDEPEDSSEGFGMCNYMF